MPRIALFLALALSPALSLATPLRAEPPLRIVTTTAHLADMTRAIAGDCATVRALIPPGTPPQSHSATPDDRAALAGAALIIATDPALEPGLAAALAPQAVDAPVLQVLRAATSIETLRAEAGNTGGTAAESPGGIDPHLWHAVSRWARIAPLIALEISDHRPACAAAIEARTRAHIDRLEALHDWTAAALASIPADTRLLVSAQDAFGYMAEPFALDIATLPADAPAAMVQALADRVIARGVPAVFPVHGADPAGLHALVAVVQGRGGTLTVAPPLHGTTLGEPGTEAGDYIGMIRANMQAITRALGGAVPD